jgi:putative DNA primase/helicase
VNDPLRKPSGQAATSTKSNGPPTDQSRISPPPRPEPFWGDPLEWSFVCPTANDASAVASQSTSEFGFNATPYRGATAKFAHGRKLIIIARDTDLGRHKAREIKDQCVQSKAAIVRVWVIPELGSVYKDVAAWCAAAKSNFVVRLDEDKPWLNDVPRVLDDRPAIEITTEEWLVRDQAIAALAEEPRIFFRGDALVQVLRPDDDEDELPGGVKLRHASGAPRIVPLSDANLRCILTQRTRLIRWSKDKNGEPIAVDVHPPEWLVKAILGKLYWCGIRELITVAECPYVKEDGTVVSEAGYDDATCTLVSPCFELGKVPLLPTRNDAKKAAHRIYKLVSQFPFADGFDWTAWLASLLTAIQRPMIRGPVPGFAFCANMAGSGKGLLIDLVGILVWGGPVPTVCYPDNKDEADKVALSLALGGVQAVHFDNLAEGQFYGGSAIDSALTTTMRGGRLLGQSRWINGMPLRPWWSLSGNNVSPHKDAHRRWIPSCLRTELETPYERNDLVIQDLKGHCASQRGKTIADALTILKAHALENHPRMEGGPLGSFEEWDHVVRGAVWYATGNDPLATQRRAAKDAPGRLEKLAMLEAWLSLPRGSTDGYTAQEVIEIASDASPMYEQIRSALMPLGDKGKLPTSNKLGYKLRAWKLENVSGLRFKDNGMRHRVAVWIVEKL